VQAADNAGGASTIKLAAGHYKLTTPPTGIGGGTDDNDPAHGDLDVLSGATLTISGAGSGSSIIDANRIDRAFAVADGGSLSLAALTIENGAAALQSSGAQWGGGIYSDGALHLTSDVTMRGNYAPGGYGGAILANTDSSAITVAGATFVDNFSDAYGGALDFDDPAGGQVTNSTFIDNSIAGDAGGAINVESSGGALDVSGSRFVHNHSPADGGALYYGGSSTLTVTRSTFDHNAGDDGGAINDDESVGLTISSTSFSENTASNGGAVYINNHTSTPNVLTGDEFDNNGATHDGGAIYWDEGTLSLTGSTLSANVADDDGGGVYVDESTVLTLTNDTLSGNDGASGGGLYFNDDPQIGFTNDTIAFNGAPAGDGGGIYRPSYTTGGGPGVVNTMVADNVGGDCGYGGLPPAFNASDDKGNNLDSDSSCFAGLSKPGDKAGIDPLLSPAAANGGPVLTDAINAGSPAIDAANGPACPATDARGVPRPQGAGCDVGAFEASTLTASISSPASGASFAQGAKVKAAFSCSEAGIAALIATCKGTVPSGQNIPTVTPGTQTFTVTAVDEQGQTVTKAVQYRVIGPPDTTITAHSIAGHSVTIKFKGSGGSGRLSFRCQLDGGKFGSCSSPKTYKHLRKGHHTFEVVARDARRNADPTPAKLRFRVHG
jgi:predicted outer membrane repeat protein